MAEKSYFGESKSVEFKREIPQRHEKFLKDIIAFANCSGGKVILGIEDGSDAVCGIGQVNPFRLSDDITNMIADACTPQIETDITAQTLEGKTVLVIDVAPGRFRPYYLKAQGKSKCRNAAISEAFHYMKIIEAWGTGLSRIRSSCREYGLREPTIEEAGDGFCVVFYRQIKSEVKGAGSETENVGSETENVGSETENVGSGAEKAGSEAEKAGSAFEKYREKLHEAGITKTYVLSVEIVYNCVGGAVFGQSNVMKYLGCSKAKAAKVMSAMRKAKIIEAIEGAGFGKYRFSEAEVQST